MPGWQHEHGSVPELCLPCRPPVRGHHVLGRKLEHGQLPGLFLPGTAQLQRHHLSGSNDQHGHVSPMRLPDRSADRPAGANLPSRLDMSPWARPIWPMAGMRLQARRCSEPSSGNPNPGSVRRTFLSRPWRRRRVQSIFRVRRPSNKGTGRRKPTAYGRRRRRPVLLPQVTAPPSPSAFPTSVCGAGAAVAGGAVRAPDGAFSTLPQSARPESGGRAA